MTSPRRIEPFFFVEEFLTFNPDGYQ